jgi:hypothetical protein
MINAVMAVTVIEASAGIDTVIDAALTAVTTNAVM